MFRTKVRIHTCKIILITSLVWILVDVALLAFYSDCLGGGGWKCKENENSAAGSAAALHSDGGSILSNSKGRGILYEQLHDRGKAEEDKTYKPSQLRRWRVVPPVPENPGMPGENGKAVIIPPDKEALMKEKFKLNQFNLLASDMISFNRSLADVRLDG